MSMKVKKRKNNSKLETGLIHYKDIITQFKLPVSNHNWVTYNLFSSNKFKEY